MLLHKIASEWHRKVFRGKSSGVLITDAFKTVGLVFFAILFTELLRLFRVGDQNLIIVYILAVLLISKMTSGYLFGLVGSALCVLAYDYLVSPPRMGFSFTYRFPITLCIMLFVSVLVSALSAQMKTSAEHALEREHQAKLLYEINQGLLAARSVEAIIELTQAYIISHVGRSVIFYTKASAQAGQGAFQKAAGDSDLDFFTTPRQLAYVRAAFERQDAAQTISDEAYCGVHYVPAVSKGKLLSVTGISCQTAPLSENDLTFLYMLMAQVALAIELQLVSDEQRRALVQAENEKLRSSLLRSISHDLRTPLTSILGASSVVLERGEYLDKQTHDKLISDIIEDSQWLIRMVENLLSITRLQGDEMKVLKKPEAAEEVVAQAVTIIRKWFPGREIRVSVPDELLIVPMDAMLISQVLINLLENAVKNSKPNSLIFVTIKKHNNTAIFEVIDQGQGISEEAFANLFKMKMFHDHKTVDSSRDMGIGLSICYSIIQAHNGRIEGMNRPQGGALFRFILPLEDAADQI